jgi:hypothetical protein
MPVGGGGGSYLANMVGRRRALMASRNALSDGPGIMGGASKVPPAQAPAPGPRKPGPKKEVETDATPAPESREERLALIQQQLDIIKHNKKMDAIARGSLRPVPGSHEAHAEQVKGYMHLLYPASRNRFP